MKHFLSQMFILAAVFKSATPETTPNSCPDSAQTKPVHIVFSPQIHNYVNGEKPLQSRDCHENDWFIIQVTTGGLVLDASDPNQIKLQQLTGSAQQLWKFERAIKPGTYYIINKQTDTALDATSETVLLRTKVGSVTQQWVTNWNGRIRNVGTNFNLDVREAIFAPGTNLIVWKDNGNKAQEFTWYKKP